MVATEDFNRDIKKCVVWFYVRKFVQRERGQLSAESHRLNTDGKNGL